MKKPRQIVIVNSDIAGKRYAIPATSKHVAQGLVGRTILELLEKDSPTWMATLNWSADTSATIVG